MDRAKRYIERLLAGETVSFRPGGHSMTGRISSGQLCTVAPVEDYATLAVGDIVLCRVHGNEYLTSSARSRRGASRQGDKDTH
jgi:hypothetical protein